MSPFARVIGRRAMALDQHWLGAQAAGARGVLLDVGTGDGRFVIDMAREHADWFCIGIDPVAQNMQRLSRIAADKPVKGGVPNALFLRGSAEQLPGPLRQLADRLTVNYPWGSLMRTMVRAEPEGLRRLRAACRDGATIGILLNRSIFEDKSYAARLQLPEEEFLESRQFADAYRMAGIVIDARRSFRGDPPIRTVWGRHLARRSARKSFMIKAVAACPAGENGRDFIDSAPCERG